nr:cytochrome C oxidase Vc family protein [Viscum album]
MSGAGKVAQAVARKEPSVVKEICCGLVVGLVFGGCWKVFQWKEQRKVREFYDLLDKGVITVDAEEA